MATYVGFKVASGYGAVLATISFIIPAIILMFFIYKIFAKFKDNKNVVKSLSVIRASVLASILISCFTVLKTTFFTESNTLEYKTIIFAIILAVIMNKKKLHPLVYMLISGIIGIVFQFAI